ncbi:MAG: hypothetical protein ACRD68_17465, partial [Pyrinomonadaceae bacterium]
LVAVREKERRYIGRQQSGSGLADLRGAILGSMLHEPGHAMGLAARILPDGNPNPNFHMTRNSEQIVEGHCHYLPADHPSRLPPSDRRHRPALHPDDYQAEGCVMFEIGSTSTTICPTCSDSIRGLRLGASMPSFNSPYD